MNQKAKEIMRRSSINPFAMNQGFNLEQIKEETNEVFHQQNPFAIINKHISESENELKINNHIEEEDEEEEMEVSNNPFSSSTNPFASKPNPFQVNSANPFQMNMNEVNETPLEAETKVLSSNPFVSHSSSNPFQVKSSSNPFESKEKKTTTPIKNIAEANQSGQDNNPILDDISMKIEIKNESQNFNRGVLFLEEDKKKRILEILKPQLTEELHKSNTEMIIKIKSRRNSLNNPLTILNKPLEISVVHEKNPELEKRAEPESFKSELATVNPKAVKNLMTNNVISQPDHVENRYLKQVNQEQNLIQCEDNQIECEIQPEPTIQIKEVENQKKSLGELKQMNEPQTVYKFDKKQENTQTLQYQSENFNKNLQNPSHEQYISNNNNFNYFQKQNSPNFDQYQITNSYQVTSQSPVHYQDKDDFSLRSVIRNVTTVKRPSHNRETYSNQYMNGPGLNVERDTVHKNSNLREIIADPRENESSFMMQANKTQYPLAMVEVNSSLKESQTNDETARYLNNNSYLKMESNNFQESQLLINQPNDSFNNSKNLNLGNLIHPYHQSFNKLHANMSKQDYVSSNFQSNNNDFKAESTIELPSNKNIEFLKYNPTNQAYKTNTDDRVVVTKETNQRFIKEEPNLNEMFKVKKEEHKQVYVSRSPKMTKKSVTSGLKIFKKIKDTHGNVIKQNVGNSINDYCENILSKIRTSHVIKNSVNLKEDRYVPVEKVNMTNFSSSRIIDRKNYFSHAKETSQRDIPNIYNTISYKTQNLESNQTGNSQQFNTRGSN
jgi:hypothetical protein